MTITPASRFMLADTEDHEFAAVWEGMAAHWALHLKDKIATAVQIDDFDADEIRAWRSAIEDPSAPCRTMGGTFPALAQRIALLMLGTVADNGGHGFSDERHERLMAAFRERGILGFPTAD